MPPVNTSQSTFTNAVPRLAVNDIDQSLAFYEQLGFQTVYHDEHFAIVKRDEVQLHLIHSPHVDPAGNGSACYLFVTHIEALYEQYVPTHAVHPRALLETKPYGVKEFAVIDPSGVLLIFAELVSAEEMSGIG